MHEDLSVFSDETLAGLYEDLMGALDDGIGTARTRQLLHRLAMEQSLRAIRGIGWEVLPFSFIIPGSLDDSAVAGLIGCSCCRSPGGLE